MTHDDVESLSEESASLREDTEILQAGYSFGLSSSEDHKGLLTAQKDRKASCSEVITEAAE